MKFYHYNTKEFKELLSLNVHGKETSDSNPYQYSKNVSLFIEPIPLNVAKLLHDQHQFFKSGTKLIQHEIDSNDIPINIYYHVVETPEATKLLYEIQDWSILSSLSEADRKLKVKEFVKEKENLEIKLGYKGKGRINLIKACNKVPKGIEKYYKELYKLSEKYPDDKMLEKYAACVPHVMIFPDQKPIKVRSTKEITLL